MIRRARTVLSPSNTLDEMRRKRRWYERHGVEEYYFINPYKNLVHGYVRGDLGFEPVDLMDGFVSPRLGIRFESRPVKLFRPDGQDFGTPTVDLAIFVVADEPAGTSGRE